MHSLQPFLDDLAESLLDTRDRAVARVIIRGNPRLCFNISMAWGLHPASELAYDMHSCRALYGPALALSREQCLVFQNPDARSPTLCTNQPSQLSLSGHVCRAIPVSHEASIHHYEDSNCTHLLGSVYVWNVAAARTFHMLRSAFSRVTVIAGDLVVDSNENLVSLSFFSSLFRVTGRMIVVGNDNLVFSHISSLVLVDSGAIHFISNRRLCDARKMQVDPASGRVLAGTADASGCSNITYTQLFMFTNLLVNTDEASAIIASAAGGAVDEDASQFTVETVGRVAEGLLVRVSLNSLGEDVLPTSAIERFVSLGVAAVEHELRIFWDNPSLSIQTVSPPEFMADATGFNSGLALDCWFW